jgi:hypothetical protein
MLKIIGFILTFLGLLVILFGTFFNHSTYIQLGCIIQAVALGLLFYKNPKSEKN